jgi:hypothetical protein
MCHFVSIDNSRHKWSVPYYVDSLTREAACLLVYERHLWYFFRDTALSVAYLTIIFLIAVNYISRIVAEALRLIEKSELCRLLCSSALNTKMNYKENVIQEHTKRSNKQMVKQYVFFYTSWCFCLISCAEQQKTWFIIFCTWRLLWKPRIDICIFLLEEMIWTISIEVFIFLACSFNHVAFS